MQVHLSFHMHFKETKKTINQKPIKHKHNVVGY